MGIVRIVSGQIVGVLLGLALGAVLFIGGFLLASSAGKVGASHEDDDVVHICVNQFSGQARVVPDGQAPNCTANETLVDLAGGAALAELAELRADLDALTEQVPECLSETEDGTALFSGCDVQIVNGMDATGTANGTGNLIIGYNEDPIFEDADRTGSHNLVVGPNHDYTSFGGLVAGIGNVVSVAYGSVSGGQSNTAEGFASSVSGGMNNTASGDRSSVSGGAENTASSNTSSVSGGIGNTASGLNSSVSGGQDGLASGGQSSVSGGNLNRATSTNSSVSGGINNEAGGINSSVSGGSSNSASGNQSSVSGGLTREAENDGQWVAGGLTQPN